MTGLVLVTTIMKNPAIDMAQISDGGQLTTLPCTDPRCSGLYPAVGIITSPDPPSWAGPTTASGAPSTYGARGPSAL